MGFASAWLNENALFPELVKEAPDKQTGIIVVIPAFDEPGIATLLDSLKICDKPDCEVEVLIVVNAPYGASTESIANNSVCLREIDKWAYDNNNRFFRVYKYDTGVAPFAAWGVGLARKCGMDEALRRFDILDKREGIIVSLDADCKVEKNYFTSFCNEFYKRKDRKACSVYFEHPLTGDQYSEQIFNSILQYELHLRYFVQGLRYSGFPHAYHTVGSALAVKALHYVRAGGMNRKQAGEDFYFIQKLAPLGGYFSLSSTTVYPSPRESYRVPFGTGVTMKKLLADTDNKFMTYNPEAFSDLKRTFDIIDDISNDDHNILSDAYSLLPSGIRSFISENEWISKISEIQNNTSSIGAFIKRFFTWLNMFRIVKYLNNIHTERYNKVPVGEAANTLLCMSGVKNSNDECSELLQIYRNLEKNQVSET